MDSQQTAIIVGAGASTDYGLPVGSLLLERIESLCRGYVPGHAPDPDFDASLIAYSNLASSELSPQELQEAAQIIQSAAPHAGSIDSLLNKHSHDRAIVGCGKLAIAFQVLRAERKAKDRIDSMHRKGAEPKSQIDENNWIGQFFKLVTDDASGIQEVEDRLSRLGLVIFNYDRCFEHYFVHALGSLFRLNIERATEAIKRLRIFHPYGSLGRLPWQKGTLRPIGLGQPAEPTLVVQSASTLRTFTEGVDPETTEINEIQSLVAGSKNLVFLGYSFHPLNMDLLRPSGQYDCPPNTIVFSTLYEVADSNKTYIEGAVQGLRPGKNVSFWSSNATCTRFFDEYWLKLRAEFF